MTGEKGVSRTAVALVLLAILALAAYLRARGIAYGLPDSLYDDEAHFVRRALAMGTGDLNPHWFHKPGLFFYVLFIDYGVYYLVSRALSLVASPDDFAAAYFNDPTPFLLIARATVALFSLGLVAATFALGRRLFSAGAGLAAALVVAVAPGVVLESKVARADVPAAFFAVLSLVWLVSMVRRGRRRDDLLAGLFAGLGMATKYYPAIFVVPLVLARIARARAAGERVFSLRLLLAPAALFLAFALASPFNVIDPTWAKETWEQRVRPMLGETAVVENDATYKGEGFWPGLAHVASVPLLPGALGTALGALAFAGVAFVAIARRRDPAALLALSPIPVFMIAAAAFNPSYAEPRHLNVLYPLFAVGWGALAEFAFVRFSPRAPFALPLAVTALACVPSFLFVERRNEALSVPDARVVAKAWIEENLEPGAKILLDSECVKLRDRKENLERLRDEARALQRDTEGEWNFSKQLDVFYEFQVKALAKWAGPTFDLHVFYHPWWKRREEEPGAVRLDEDPHDRMMANPLHARGVDPLETYEARGYRYLVTERRLYGKYLEEPMRTNFPSFARFYGAAVTRPLVREFADPARPEVVVQVFRLRAGG